MKRIKITFEVKSEHKKERHTSKFEKLIGAFMRLASTLRPEAMFKFLRLIVVLMALIYLLCRILPLILNRL